MGKVYRGIVLHGETNDQIKAKGGKISQNGFSSNLNALNQKFFFKHSGIFT